MNILDQIKAEVERRKNYISVTHFAEELLSFLDTLQEQPVCEELEEEIQKYEFEKGHRYYPNVADIARHFYELGQQSKPITKFKIGDTIWSRNNEGTKFTIVDIKDGWYYADDGDKVCFDVIHQYYELYKPEVSEELEEEIERYIPTSLAVKFPTTDIETIKSDIRYIARHFAQWGAESKKR